MASSMSLSVSNLRSGIFKAASNTLPSKRQGSKANNATSLPNMTAPKDSNKPDFQEGHVADKLVSSNAILEIVSSS
ncbi:unnamed protein product [Clonostachys rhizophaga]|uniref:Uncharacterized protein n=1 Tax=Clonostachys rhizophaga TaxID=160324 RepID=A0A9N9V7G4_9HYPO|nr:unnamed protein product [Clonostachys rhizophaga]